MPIYHCSISTVNNTWKYSSHELPRNVKLISVTIGGDVTFHQALSLSIYAANITAWAANIPKIFGYEKDYDTNVSSRNHYLVFPLHGIEILDGNITMVLYQNSGGALDYQFTIYYEVMKHG